MIKAQIPERLKVESFAVRWVMMQKTHTRVLAFCVKFVTVTLSIFLHQGIIEVIFDNSLSISFSSSSFVFPSLSFSRKMVIVAFLGIWLHF